jgi:hypothetical protein
MNSLTVWRTRIQKNEDVKIITGTVTSLRKIVTAFHGTKRLNILQTPRSKIRTISFFSSRNKPREILSRLHPSLCYKKDFPFAPPNPYHKRSSRLRHKENFPGLQCLGWKEHFVLTNHMQIPWREKIRNFNVEDGQALWERNRTEAIRNATA